MAITEIKQAEEMQREDMVNAPTEERQEQITKAMKIAADLLVKVLGSHVSVMVCIGEPSERINTQTSTSESKQTVEQYLEMSVFAEQRNCSSMELATVCMSVMNRYPDVYDILKHVIAEREIKRLFMQALPTTGTRQ